jgi:putative ATP-binding cassette transporter
VTSERRVRITRTTWSRFGRALKDFSSSEVGWRARGLFGLLVALLVVFNVLNVLNSYVGRDFMTAIANRDAAGVTWQAIVYLGVFAASTLVGAFWSFSSSGWACSGGSGSPVSFLARTCSATPTIA